MANTLNPLPSLLRASAWDAGNQRMRKAGRTKWSVGDYNESVRVWDRLRTACYGEGPEGCARFGYAEAMERAGLLSLTTKDFYGAFEKAWTEYVASFEQIAA